MVQNGDQGVSTPGRAPMMLGAATPGQWPFGVNFVKRGLRVMSSPIFLTFHENSFVLIVGCSPTLVSCYPSFTTWWRQKRDNRETRHIIIFIHLHAGLIITKANFEN